MDRNLVYVSKKIRKKITINNYSFVKYEQENFLTFLVGLVTCQIQYTNVAVQSWLD